MRLQTVAAILVLIGAIALSVEQPPASCCRTDLEVVNDPEYADVASNPEASGCGTARLRRIDTNEVVIETASCDRDVDSWFRFSPSERKWDAMDRVASTIFTSGATMLQPNSDGQVLYRWSDKLPGLFLRSDDAGATWTLPKNLINGQPPAEFARKVTNSEAYHLWIDIVGFQPSRPRAVYSTMRLVPVATNFAVRSEQNVPGVFISYDGGEKWSEYTQTILQPALFAVSPNNPSVLFCVGANGMARSMDGGRTLQPVASQEILEMPIRFSTETIEERVSREGLRKIPVEVRQILMDPADTRIVYLVTNRAVYKTRDLGDTWCRLDLGSNEINFANSMAVNPSNPQEIFIGTRYGLLWSRDSGCTFERLLAPNFEDRAEGKVK